MLSPNKKQRNSRSPSHSPSHSISPDPLLSDDALAKQENQLVSDRDAMAKQQPMEIDMYEPHTFDDTIFYSVDDAITKIGNGKFQYRLMFLTGGIWAADAMEMMLLSFVMPILKDEWSLQPPFDGAISSVVFAGMLCGTAFWSILADKIGRKKVVIFSNLGCAVFGAISGLAPEIYFMLVMRFMVGFTVGGSGSAYTLFAEYAPQDIRGKLLVIEQGFWAVGAIFSVLLAWLCLVNFTWHWYMILSSIPLFIVSAFWKWVPESSRWLLACGRVDEAQQVLQYVSEVNGASLPIGQLRPVKISQRGNPCDAFAPKYRKHSFLLYTAFFMCVLGYYGICFISVKFFEEVAGSAADAEHGWKSSRTYWESLVAASSEIPAVFVGIYLIDRIGRKCTMLIAFGAFTACNFLLMFVFIQQHAVLGVGCVFLARMNISLAFMTIYIYFSEYYPTSVRATALGMASALGRIAGTMTSFISEDLPFSIGMLIYALSGLVAFACIVFVMETMGHAMATAVVEPPQWLQDNVKQVDVDVDEQVYDATFEMNRIQHPQYEKIDESEKNKSNSSSSSSSSSDDSNRRDL